MKSNILIALGCSFTEGIGCKKSPRTSGWPSRLGKKLGYDKVLNLGQGGSSNWTHVNLLLKILSEKDFTDSNVLVVWMMTEPIRFSLYSGISTKQEYYEVELKNFLPLHENPNNFEKEYVNKIKHIDIASRYNQITHIKLVEQICGNNNFELIITSWNKDSKNLPSIYQSKNYLDTEMTEVWGEGPFQVEEFKKSKSICGHPNEIGYEKISQIIYDKIKSNHPHIKTYKEKQTIENKYMGDTITITTPFTKKII